MLLTIAAAGVLTEQAREARGRDPYALVSGGRMAMANLNSPREEILASGIRRGEPQNEILLLVDLDWQDDSGQRRRVTGYRLDEATAAGLRRDSFLTWPASVQLQYLDRADIARPAPGTMAFITALPPTAPAYQPLCEPWVHCRLIVLPPDQLSPAEEAARNVDYVLDRAPFAFQLAVGLLGLMLILRFVGIIHNRSSWE